MTKVSNKNGRGFVDGCWAFKGSHVWGEWLSKRCYVVYSYGVHFPMYAKVRGAWYENKDKYSVSTSRHMSQYRPSGIIVDKLDTKAMLHLIHVQNDYDAKELAAVPVPSPGKE